MRLLSKILRKFKKVVKRIFKHESAVNLTSMKNNVFPIVHDIITDDQICKLKESIRISFIGDLILLRDMIQTAWDSNKNSYDFHHMFLEVQDILQKSNLSIGVLEGPLAGSMYSYSTSTFVDNIPIRLNFPDSFATAIKEAGVDVVSLANNHLYDCEKEGLIRTIHVLDEIGLNHVGGYKNFKEKTTIFCCNVGNIKIAIIAFTYSPNGVSDDFFYNEDTKDLTYGLVSHDSLYIEQCKKDIKENISRAKECDPNIIIAMPHLGTQFSSQPDAMQNFWVNLLVDEGVHIILGCHAHHVQPIKWVQSKSGQMSLVVYCPGNFVNSYLGCSGDLSMLVNVYLSTDRKQPIAAGCVPLYAYADDKKRYRAIPFYKLLSSSNNYILSHNEFKHVSELHNLFSSVVFGHESSIDQIQTEYFLFKDKGYVRNKVATIELDKDNKFVNLIQKSESICFIGDSITDGTMNGGYGWYEPIVASFKKKIAKIANGGATSKSIINSILQQEDLCYELFIVAIGCNDIRYRDNARCAMDAIEYVKHIDEISRILKSHNKNVNMIFISPWESADFDPHCSISIEEKEKLYEEYNNQLKIWCLENHVYYVNPNPYIREQTYNFKNTIMLKDHIHPNAYEGIQLFSRAVLNSI